MARAAVRGFAVLAAVVLMTGVAGCRPRATANAVAPAPAVDVKALPEIGKGRQIAPGVRFHSVTVPRGGDTDRLWIYLPEKPPKGPMPCVFIAPAGSRLFHGMDLGEGDRPEHLPYARAGMAVVAYEIAGHVEDGATDAEVLAAARQFKESDAGLQNARLAIDYALAKLPGIDPKRLYTAGHSSAGTMALLLAENEPRIAACVAYAPGTDVVTWLGPALPELEQAVPGFRAFIERSSPDRGIARLKCPVFLFHAADDTNVKRQEVAGFHQRLRQTNPSATFVQVPTGGHYDSMIRQGVPQAIQWLKQLPR